jgi:hypothetical protein
MLPEYRPLGGAEIAELQLLSDEVYAKLRAANPQAIRALDGYTNAKTEKHALINGVLRGGSGVSGTDRREVMDEYVPYIDSAMKEFKVPFGATLYCGTNAKHYKHWDVGSVRVKKEYLSTSVEKKVADMFLRSKENDGKEPLMLEIFVPAGTRGIYIGTNTASEKNENEFLLGRGLEYKVVGRPGDILRLEVLR